MGLISRVSSRTYRTFTREMTFEVGQKAIVDWRGCLYEAKIVRTDFLREDDKHYFIHFNGWSSNHDEWRGIEDIFPFTEENITTLKEQRVYLKKLVAEKKAGKRKAPGEGSVSPSRSESSTSSKKKKVTDF